MKNLIEVKEGKLENGRRESNETGRKCESNEEKGRTGSEEREGGVAPEVASAIENGGVGAVGRREPTEIGVAAVGSEERAEIGVRAEESMGSGKRGDGPATMEWVEDASSVEWVEDVAVAAGEELAVVDGLPPEGVKEERYLSMEEVERDYIRRVDVAEALEEAYRNGKSEAMEVYWAENSEETGSVLLPLRKSVWG